MRSLQDQFCDVGFVRIGGAFDRPEADRMLAGIWRELERRHGARRDDRETWPTGAVYDLKSSKTARSAMAIFGPRLRRALDELFGRGEWQEPRKPGFVLCTFPHTNAWDIPSGHWHPDFDLVGARAPVLDPLSVVTMFVFHDDVGPGGGGTLLIERSHRMVDSYVRTLPDELPDGFDVRHRFMRHHPWLDELRAPVPRPGRSARFLGEPSDVLGVDARVVELTGTRGDVIITHPWLFHCGAPNASDRPRIMRRSYVRRRAGETAEAPGFVGSGHRPA